MLNFHNFLLFFKWFPYVIIINYKTYICKIAFNIKYTPGRSICTVEHVFFCLWLFSDFIDAPIFSKTNAAICSTKYNKNILGLIPQLFMNMFSMAWLENQQTDENSHIFFFWTCILAWTCIFCESIIINRLSISKKMRFFSSIFFGLLSPNGWEFDLIVAHLVPDMLPGLSISKQMRIWSDTRTPCS